MHILDSSTLRNERSVQNYIINMFSAGPQITGGGCSWGGIPPTTNTHTHKMVCRKYRFKSIGNSISQLQNLSLSPPPSLRRTTFCTALLSEEYSEKKSRFELYYTHGQFILKKRRTIEMPNIAQNCRYT